MLSEHQNKNANYLRILMTLRALRQRGDITEKEYRRAKKILSEPDRRRHCPYGLNCNLHGFHKNSLRRFSVW